MDKFNFQLQEDNWDEHWDRYMAASQSNPASHYRQKFILDLIRSHSTAGLELKILDVGSGFGYFLFQCTHILPGAKCVGFELSDTGVQIARKKVPQASFFTVNMTAPTQQTSEYHGWATIAICSEVLEHTDDPELFLKCIYPYLENRGIMILSVPGGPISNFDRHIGHRKHFTIGEIQNLLTSAGYQSVEIFRAGFPFFNLYRLIVILRGSQLVKDMDQESNGITKKIAFIVMRSFDLLFNLNMADFPLGWQLIAIAKKSHHN